MRRRGWLTILLLTLNACGEGPVFDLSNFQDSFDAVVFNNKVDILWVIDTTPSMREDREKIQNEISYMFSEMDSKKLDYRMAVVTMDMARNSTPALSGGRFVGSPTVITPATNNRVQVFRNMLNVAESGSQFAEGLGAMKAALSRERLAQENQGFYRDEALLAVIFVTDDRDWSDEEPQDYIQFLDSKKQALANGNKAWMANFIGVIEDSSACRTMGRVSMVGTQFMQVVAASEGSIHSICRDSLSSSVVNIQRSIVQTITDWKIAEPAVLGTIRVEINGVLIAENSENGWTYDASKRLIRFHGNAIPPADARVVVDYKPESIGLNP